eukprot:516218_1
MWRMFDGSSPPFLCPPKFYHEYYKPLIFKNTKGWVMDNIINDLIFQYVNGECDYSDSFLESKDYLYLQYSLGQKFLLKTAKIEICDNNLNDNDNRYVMDSNNIDSNTLELELIKQMLEDGFSLSDDMIEIWFYSNTSFNSYGFYSKTFRICGKTKLKSYYSRQFKPIYMEIQLKTEGSNNDNDKNKNNNNENDVGNPNDIYSLSFKFSDSLELFWLKGLYDWDCWKENDIKRFKL